MTVEFLTTFFGWMAVINIAYLALGAVAVMGLQSWMISVHQRLFRLDEQDLNRHSPGGMPLDAKIT